MCFFIYLNRKANESRFTAQEVDDVVIVSTVEQKENNRVVIELALTISTSDNVTQLSVVSKDVLAALLNNLTQDFDDFEVTSV